MEYLDGQPLSKLIPPGGLAIETAQRYALQIADALAYVHKHGMLHRDVKSSNVMVTREGRVKLLDFGLARRVEPAERDATLTSETLTQSGAVVGTLAYMAPEVLSGEDADQRSDVWALGVLLHEMVAGARPFQGSSEFTLTSAILREPAPPLPNYTPAGLRNIITRCLAKEPAQRYESAIEVAAALEAVSAASAPAIVSSKRRIWPWIAILAAAAVAFAFWVGPRTKRSMRSPDQIRSLAVLPFENRSSDAGQEFFTDGMTEQLITDLSKIRSLRVISRASIIRYRGTQKPLSEVARDLGVDGLVVGSVMRSAGKVRIAAQLIEARGDQNIWAESYDRELSEVLGLQREVARNIANEIRVTLSPAEQANLTSGRHVDPAVYDLVLRGNYFANKGDEDNLRQGLRYVQQAIDKDASYAPAHAAAAFIYSQLSTVHAPPREVMPKAKAAAERALEIDETLADAHLSLAAVLLFYEWDWPEAEKHLKRAVQLNPSSAAGHMLKANYFAANGHSAEALSEVRLAQKLDPLSVQVQINLVFSLIGARQFDESIAEARRFATREPNMPLFYVAAALAHGEKGEFDQAVEAIEKASSMTDTFTVKAMTAHVYAAKGDRRKAEQLLAELKEISKQRYVCAYEIAHTYVKLGDKTQAFEWLEKGKRDRADCMIWLLSEPWMVPLHGDARYNALIKQIGLGTGKAGATP
jgi:serine/threonine protein kinase/Flp pilus assembly protein TadD